jgi:hypothetical protein
LKEEAYVSQPLGFKNPISRTECTNSIRLSMASSKLHVHLRDFLLTDGFEIGKVDSTLFSKQVKGGGLFICQIYVDDIIFGGANEKHNKAFEKLMT